MTEQAPSDDVFVPLECVEGMLRTLAENQGNGRMTVNYTCLKIPKQEWQGVGTGERSGGGWKVRVSLIRDGERLLRILRRIREAYAKALSEFVSTGDSPKLCSRWNAYNLAKKNLGKHILLTLIGKVPLDLRWRNVFVTRELAWVGTYDDADYHLHLNAPENYGSLYEYPIHRVF